MNQLSVADEPSLLVIERELFTPLHYEGLPQKLK
jgi:hypothetical protein